MIEREVWDSCNPSWKKNFICRLENNGLWRMEQERSGKNVWGKWVFTIEQIDPNRKAPTFADQRNFFTGLLEAEWRNDNFVFDDGTSRNPQKDKKLEMFRRFFEDVSKRFNEEVKNGIDYYIKIGEVKNGKN